MSWQGLHAEMCGWSPKAEAPLLPASQGKAEGFPIRGTWVTQGEVMNARYPLATYASKAILSLRELATPSQPNRGVISNSLKTPSVSMGKLWGTAQKGAPKGQEPLPWLWGPGSGVPGLEEIVPPGADSAGKSQSLSWSFL